MKKVFREKKYASFPIKFDLKMKLTTLFLIVSLFQLQANESYAQKTKVTLTLENVSIEKVLDKIESLTEFKFIYKDNAVDYQKIVSVNVKKKQIQSILQKLFAGSNIVYKVVDKQIILKPGEIIPKVNKEEALINELKPQDIVVNGIVSDLNGQPLPGANIIEKGTNNGAQTDFDGKFSISVKDGGTVLVISYLGFLTQEIAISNQTTIAVILQEDTAKLDEVVVVGYGTQKKVNLTGAVSSVSIKDIENRPAPNVATLLAGQVPGLAVIQQSGRPGQSAGQFRIRGIGSLGNNEDERNRKNSPLILVDGIEGDLQDVDVNDIENVSVLKDASAAIYGVRAANGVILVTTKTGRTGVPVVKYHGGVGTQKLLKYQTELTRTIMLDCIMKLELTMEVLLYFQMMI